MKNNFVNRFLQGICLVFVLIGYTNQVCAQSNYWAMPPKNWNMQISPISNTTITGASSIAYMASNGAYDDLGNLLFYIQDNNVTGPTGTSIGTLPDYTTSGTTWSTLGPEIAVVPVPGQCKQFFIIYTKGNGMTSSTSLLYVKIDCTGASPVLSTTTQLALFGGSFGALAVSKLNSSVRYLFALGTTPLAVNSIECFTISSTGIGTRTTTVSASDVGYSSLFHYNDFYANELELSPDQKYLAWGFTDLTTNVSLLEINPSTYAKVSGTIYAVSNVQGLEFNNVSGTSTRIFMSTTSGGISYVDIGTSTVNTIPSSSAYNNTFLELAKNGFIYGVNNSGSMFYFDGNAASYTSTSIAAATAGTIYSNSGCNLYGGEVTYRLPDQVDGDLYPTANPTISGAASICTGSTATYTLSGSYNASTTYTWTVTGGTPSSYTGTGSTLAITWSSSPGTISVSGGNCTTPSGYTVTVNPNTGITASATPSTISLGATSTLSASGGTGTYTWSPAGSLSNPSIANPTATPTTTTVYTVTNTNSYGCLATATTTVTVTSPECGLTINTSITSNANASTIFTPGTISNTNISIASGVTLTIDNNFTFSGCNFNMGPNAKIHITTNHILTFQSKTHLFACGDMWDGIYIDAQGKLYVTDNTFVEDALNAVVSVGGGYFNINTAIFNRNYKSVDVQTITLGTHPGIIANSIFTSRYLPSFVSTGNASNYSVATILAYPLSSFPVANMQSPNAGTVSPYAVYVTDVPNINIGTAAASSTNIFDNIGNGITLLRSNSTIYNNAFQNMPNAAACGGCATISGIGIQATGVATGTYSVTIGGTTTNKPNTFSNVYNSIQVDNYQQTTILNSTITNSVTLTGSTGIGKYGIVVQPAASNTIDVENNSITNCTYGVYLNRSTNGINSVSTLVSGNSITANSNGYCTYGINLTDITNSGSTTPVDKIKISNNTITEAYTCVYAMNVKNSLVIYSNPVLHIRNDGATPGNGIRTQNSKYVRIYNNTDIALVPATSPVTSTNINCKGIYVLTSPNNEITCNTISNMGESMVFYASCVSSTLRNNLMNGGNRGLVLRTNGEIGTQGSSTQPCGLWWSGLFNANTFTDGTNNANTNSILYISNSGAPLGSSGTPSVNSGTGLSSTYYTSGTGLVTTSSGSPINCSTDIIITRLASQQNEQNTTGIKGNADAHGFVVYPNPNEGSFTLSVQNDDPKDIYVYDVMGKLIYENKNDTQRSLTIDISKFAKGMYTVKVISNGTIQTQKVISQ